MNLKKTLVIALAGLLCLASLTADAAVAGRGFQASIEADVVTSYVWRGIEKHDEAQRRAILPKARTHEITGDTAVNLVYRRSRRRGISWRESREAGNLS